jgi:hypothetical protein
VSALSECRSANGSVIPSVSTVEGEIDVEHTRPATDRCPGRSRARFRAVTAARGDSAARGSADSAAPRLQLRLRLLVASVSCHLPASVTVRHAPCPALNTDCAGPFRIHAQIASQVGSTRPADPPDRSPDTPNGHLADIWQETQAIGRPGGSPEPRADRPPVEEGQSLPGSAD